MPVARAIFLPSFHSYLPPAESHDCPPTERILWQESHHRLLLRPTLPDPAAEILGAAPDDAAYKTAAERQGVGMASSTRIPARIAGVMMVFATGLNGDRHRANGGLRLRVRQQLRADGRQRRYGRGALGNAGSEEELERRGEAVRPADGDRPLQGQQGPDRGGPAGRPHAAQHAAAEAPADRERPLHQDGLGVRQGPYGGDW